MQIENEILNCEDEPILKINNVSKREIYKPKGSEHQDTIYNWIKSGKFSILGNYTGGMARCGPFNYTIVINNETEDLYITTSLQTNYSYMGNKKDFETFNCIKGKALFFLS